MTLSDKAITDLRKALNKSYGPSFDASLNDGEISEIGELLLVAIAEGLKMKVQQKNHTNSF